MMKRIFGGFALLVVIGAASLLFAPVRIEFQSWLPGVFAAESAAPAQPAKRAARPVPVKTATAKSQDVPIYLEGVGTVKARSTVAIKSRVEGQLFEANVKEGQSVRKGDELFRLDARPLQARLKEVKAVLARDRANHAKSVADVERFKSLSSKGFSPKTRLEDALTLVDTSAATVQASEAETELAQLNLDYATIRSPIDGRVGRILITPGNIVKPNDTQPLLVITQTKPVYVSFSVPEQHMDTLRAHMAGDPLDVDVSTQAEVSTVATGKLFFINNEVDDSTGSIQLLATFENADERLVPGQFVRSRVLLSTLRDAILVPSRAVQINQKGHYVWVVKKDKTIEMRPIAVGPDVESDTVIDKGLKAGETVVTDGQLRLFPSAMVAPVDGKSPRGGKGKKPGKGAKNAEASS